MADWIQAVPLTAFQRSILAELAKVPTEDRYLAGGAALHFSPQSTRYSDDLDFFHDSEQRVAAAFSQDRATLDEAGFDLDVELSLPGFVRAVVTKGDDATRVDWAHDSAWRFMPLVRDEFGGLLLHPVDLAVNKLLALAGRDEPRDFVDILFAHREILAIAGLAWAAVGKDPGLSPGSLLELLKRHGRYRPEDFERLRLARAFDLPEAKQQWLDALRDAGSFARSRPPAEIGCLYYSGELDRFVIPAPDVGLDAQGVVAHYGRPGGVVPRPTGAPLEGA